MPEKVGWNTGREHRRGTWEPIGRNWIYRRWPRRTLRRCGRPCPWLFAKAVYLSWKRYDWFQDGRQRPGGGTGVLGAEGWLSWVCENGDTTGAFHDRGVVWDTPVAVQAGEGKDWVQEMTMHPPTKDDVIIALLKMPRQPTKPLLKKGTGVPSSKPRQLDPRAHHQKNAKRCVVGILWMLKSLGALCSLKVRRSGTTNVYVNVNLSHCMVHLSLECLRRSVDRNRAPHTLDSFCGRLVARVCHCFGKWVPWVKQTVRCSVVLLNMVWPKQVRVVWRGPLEYPTSCSSSSDTSWSDESASGHGDVENFVLYSFAHHACCPLLHGGLEQELFTVALTCHSALDVISQYQNFEFCYRAWQSYSVPRVMTEATMIGDKNLLLEKRGALRTRWMRTMGSLGTFSASDPDSPGDKHVHETDAGIEEGLEWRKETSETRREGGGIGTSAEQVVPVVRGSRCGCEDMVVGRQIIFCQGRHRQLWYSDGFHQSCESLEP